ncbi:hypothetical protein QUF95_24290 [Paenibacillus silvae]|jgi:hypothetical protein|uniref:hypothetical protein n=1 Tax=Paenibacillus silvae TaxID=1325358 RepID=UPI0025A2DBFC|nr:hypothetical protein [Paenibacillus silvae]MDM5280491.1 hypothetical protein [Paenibacillus silvae]
MKTATAKKSLSVFFLAVSIIAASGVVHAASASYNASVPVWGDFESGKLKKADTTSAKNKVTYIEDDRALVSWIENQGGSNLTTKVSYSSTGSYVMDYDGNASGLVGTDVLLNISTGSSNFTSTDTKGSWSPDNF